MPQELFTAVTAFTYSQQFSQLLPALSNLRHDIDVGSFRYDIGDIIILNQSHINVSKEIVSQ